MKKLGRRSERLSLEGLAEQIDQAFKFGGISYSGGYSMAGSPGVEPSATFQAYVEQIHKRNGIVSAAVLARSLLISQLRFRWRNESDTENGRLFGTPELGVIEYPAPDLTRTRLLTAAEQHVSYAGNAYFHRPRGGDLRLLRPDWVGVVIDSDEDPTTPYGAADARVIGYLYYPGGCRDDAYPIPLAEVAQWAPEPDPLCWWRGASWVTSVLREIVADGQATDHVQKFFTNAATPQLVFKLDKTLKPEAVQRFASMMSEQSEGVSNAYRNLYVGGGADVQVVGANLQQLDMKGMQGGFETRVSARSRVPATVLGIREGMAGSALNAGNYGATRRMWADGWFSPTADGLAETLERILVKPAGPIVLAPDVSRVLFLQEDRKDEADIMAANVTAVGGLVTAGFDPASAVLAVTTGDLSKLAHTGLYSVQLQKPGKNEGAA